MEENEVKKEKTFYKKWWFWVIVLAIVAVIGVTIVMTIAATGGINEIALSVQSIDDEATVYTSTGGNTIIVRIPNYSEVSINDLNEIKNIIKNNLESVLINYSRFIMISDLTDYNNDKIMSVAVYNLPDMELNMNESKAYIDSSSSTIEDILE